MSSDTPDAGPVITRAARRRRERRKRRLLAAGALASLACGAALVMGMALGGGDTRVDVDDPPPASRDTSASPAPTPTATRGPVADGQQQTSAEAAAPSASLEAPAPEAQQDGAAGDEGGASGDGSGGGAASGGAASGGDTEAGTGTDGGSDPERDEGCEAGYSVAEEWYGGFEAEVTVTADGSISGWEVTLEYPDDQEIDAAWNADVSGGDGVYTASDVGRNGSLSDGQSVGFGVVGSHSGDNGRPAVSCTAS